jgi:hypothetical protein
VSAVQIRRSRPRSEVSVGMPAPLAGYRFSL